MKKIVYCLVFLPIMAYSQSVLPLGSSGESAHIQSNSRSGPQGKISISASCYGTNNRSTTNPISPDGTIYLHLVSSKLPKGIIVKFPAIMTKKFDGLIKDYTCGIYYASKTEIEAVNPKAYTYTAFPCVTQSLSTDISGFVSAGEDYGNIEVFSYQDLGSTGVAQYYGGTGEMGKGTKHNDISYSKVQQSNGSLAETLSLTAQYPGQDGFCGGYHSPLMLFFNKDRPSFSGKSEFLLKSKGGGITSWVEKNHSGYFLVKVEDKKKGVYKASQLFGDEAYFSSGFSDLAMLDSNKDGVISKKDKKFNTLYLWKDKNSDSKSSKGELISLSSKGITELDLNYDRSYNIIFNASASANGKSSFSYKLKSKNLKGIILDVYFKGR